MFDIDGTLLLSDGAGRRAIHRALTEVYGTTGPLDHPFDGKTDPQIVRELMRLAGHEDPRIDDGLELLFAKYLDYLEDELASRQHRAYTLPGVPQLLDELERREDVVLGLLTGNLERGAHAKLDAVGLDHQRFRVGAFGSDHEIRAELPAIAHGRARDSLGLELSADSIIVIGDTPADMTCGQTLGTCAIGVATGRYTVEQLEEHEPLAVFSDLSDTRAVMRALVGD